MKRKEKHPSILSMETIKEQIEQFREKLDEVPLLVKAEKASKVPKEYLVVGGGALFFSLLFLRLGAGSLCGIVGFFYPALKSLEAIENKIRGDDTQWLIYWVVYSFFSIIEVFEGILLLWIPFYYAFKLAFLLWAMLPQTKGAKFLYDSFLKDFLKQNESRIDAVLVDARKSASTLAAEVAAATAEVSAAGLSIAAQYASRNTGTPDASGATTKKSE